MIIRKGTYASSVLAIMLLSQGASAQTDVDAHDGEKRRLASSAQQALLVDGETGTVLFEKNPDKPFPPASLAKMLTMEIVFGRLKEGKLTEDTVFPVSVHAWRTGGAPSGASTMFAAVRSNVPVSALIRGTIVQSANDAAIVLAEGIAGSEDAFASLMNRRAKELGLAGSHFVNPTGLPADGQYVTVRDLIKLAEHIRQTYPKLYELYAEPAFEWNKILQRNRNPLFAMDLGADGMETGYTEKSGYSLVGVTETDGRTTYLAISGLKSASERAEEARKLLSFAQREFEPRTLFRDRTAVADATVFGGTQDLVPLKVDGDVRALVPRGDGEHVAVKVRYQGPLIAPVEDGAEVAALDVIVGDKPVLSRRLFAAGTVPVGSFTDRAIGAAKELAVGWLRAF